MCHTQASEKLQQEWKWNNMLPCFFVQQIMQILLTASSSWAMSLTFADRQLKNTQLPPKLWLHRILPTPLFTPKRLKLFRSCIGKCSLAIHGIMWIWTDSNDLLNYMGMNRLSSQLSLAKWLGSCLQPSCEWSNCLHAFHALRKRLCSFHRLPSHVFQPCPGLYSPLYYILIIHT